MTDLVLSCLVETSPGAFLEVEDEVSGYTLASDSFSGYSKALKQKTVGDDMTWLRGELVTSSGPSNITEPLSVWVEGDDHFEFEVRLKALEAALTEQLTYRIIRTINNAKQTWSCQPVKDLQVVTQMEYIFATRGKLVAQVPRLPDIILEEV